MATYKNSTIKLLILITIFVVITLSGCFSEWHGDLAQIVISIGGAERAVTGGYDPKDSATHQKLQYEIALTNGMKLLKFSFKGNTIFETFVIPGEWNVLINSYYEGEIYATGSIDVILKPGLNNETITIDMYQSAYSEVPGKNLAEKLKWLSKIAIKNCNYLIMINEDENLEPQTLSYDGKKISITLKGEKERTVSLSGNGSLFTIKSGVTLILDKNIILKGHASNNTSLVKINSGGTLEMKSMSKITGNTVTTNESGGGVYVAGNGTFTMRGGTIIANTAKCAGGVVVMENGTFTMKGGDICKNHAIGEYSSGGGVQVWNNAKFIMEDGNINENTASDCGGGVNVAEGGYFLMKEGTIYKNTAGGWSGGGVYVHGGTFDMGEKGDTGDGGIITGNDADCGGGVCVTKSDNKNGYFNMYNGEISVNIAHNQDYSRGGGVLVNVGGTLNMSGGTISRNESQGTKSDCSYVGGGVDVSGDFNMTGGTITGNKAIGRGGGVHVEDTGTIKKTTGTITGYTSDSTNGNVVYSDTSKTTVKTDGGHAVYVDSKPNNKYRNTTAGLNDQLDSSKSGSVGGWN